MRARCGEPKSCGLKRVDPIVVESVVGDVEGLALVRRSEKRPRDHALFEVSGFKGAASFVGFADCTANMLTALKERVFYHIIGGVASVPTVPADELVRNTLLPFKRLFARRVFPSIPVTVEKFPQVYSGSKRAIYERAAERVKVAGWRQSWAYLKTFLKHEKIMIANKRLVPRVIQPRTPEYNVCLGRYLRHLEHPIYRIIDQLCGGPTVMKGYNAVEVGGHIASMWEEFQHPVAVGLDASRFDQHVSAPLLRWEHSIYKLFYQGKDKAELTKLLRQQIHNVGFAETPEGVWKYTKEGCRASGDMNTALGNCLIMCAMVHAYLGSIGVTKWRLANNGDDCVVMLEREDLSKLGNLDAWFQRMGFVMAREEPVYEIEKIEFCQAHPVWDGEKWRMVRNVTTAISKDTTYLSSFATEKEYSHYRYVVAQGGLALCNGIPMMQSFYQHLGGGAVEGRFSDKRVLDSGFMVLARGLQARSSVVTDAARVSFWRAFGFTPTEQIEWEAVFNNSPPMTTTVVEGGAEHWNL